MTNHTRGSGFTYIL